MARHSELRLTPRTVTSDRRARNEERTALILRDAHGPYARRGMALEFDRFAFFSDAVYAIALTLLVVGIAVPTVENTHSSREMWDLLVDLRAEFVSFFVGFAVIGRYWLAHHRFVAVLAAVDTRLMALNLVYLAFIAFLPFPTALVGRYEQNAVAFAFFAGILSCVQRARDHALRHGRAPRTAGGDRAARCVPLRGRGFDVTGGRVRALDPARCSNQLDRRAPFLGPHLAA
jgi:hypothetical protein